MWDWSTYILFLFSLLISYFCLSVFDKTKSRKKIIWIFFAIMPTLLLFCLRDKTVGIDLIRYRYHVNDSRFYSFEDVFHFFSEPLSRIIYRISYELGGLQAFIILTSFVEYFFVFFALILFYKRGIEVRLLFIFFFAYVIIRSCSMVRQGMALSCSLCAYAYLYGEGKSRTKKYFLFSLIALGFHNSAIINLPIYIISKIKNDESKRKIWIRYLIISTLAIILFIFIGISNLSDIFLNMTEDRYSEDRFEMEEKWGVGNFLIRFPLVILVICSSSKLNSVYKDKYIPYVLLLVFDLFFSQIKYLSADLERLTMYTGLSSFIILTMLAQTYSSNKKIGSMVNFVFFILAFFYYTFYMYQWGVKGGGGIGNGIMPYHFWK